MFVACAPEEIGTGEDVAIFGLWESGEKPTIKAVIVTGETEVAVPNQFMELVFPDGERASFKFLDQVYQLESERTPQPGETLQLEWYRQSDTAFAFVMMPPQPTNVVVTNDTIQSEADDESVISWSMEGAQSEFALRLECLELNALSLPWSPGDFLQLYSGPQVATQLTLSPQSFACYGSHQLTISVLNDELRDVFFFDRSDIRGLLRQGPDNVSGGAGFVSGVSTRKILLEVE
jgi:hypothetical protein